MKITHRPLIAISRGLVGAQSGQARADTLKHKLPELHHPHRYRSAPLAPKKSAMRYGFFWSLAAVAILTMTHAVTTTAAQGVTPEQSLPQGLLPSDWPWWRGPTHNGEAPRGQSPPLSWSDQVNVQWSVNIPGRGHGSPIVAGDRIYLASCDEPSGSQSVYAFDRTDGALAWARQIYASKAMRKNERSTGASSTIACDGTRLFINFLNDGEVSTTALSLVGATLWQTKLTDYIIHQGYGSSPLIYRDTVIVSADNKGGGAVAAINRQSGEILWKRERPPTPNYSSPVVHTLHGREQLIMIGCDLVSSFDPASGETIWERKGATTECVTTTVSDGQRIFTSGGYPRNHVAAIRADGSAKIDWENEQRLYVPSLLYSGGHLYAVLDAGIAICWNSETGEERWKSRLGGNFSASPVLVGDMIFATSEAGQTHIFRATPDRFEALATNALGQEVFATPAICGDQIFFRVAYFEGNIRQEKLVCIADLKK